MAIHLRALSVTGVNSTSTRLRQKNPQHKTVRVSCFTGISPSARKTLAPISCNRSLGMRTEGCLTRPDREQVLNRLRMHVTGPSSATVIAMSLGPNGCIVHWKPIGMSAEFDNMVLVNGQLRSQNEAVGFLWHPWAIECCVHWLARAKRLGAAPEEIVGVRRSLGHLVVDFADRTIAKHKSGPTFAAAELLYCLGSIDAPTNDSRHEQR